MLRFLMAVALSMTMLSFSVLAEESTDAMFGLKWGMTPATIKKLGISLVKKEADRNFEDYTAKSLPKNISDVEFYLLRFSDGKLVKLVAFSENITGDITGSQGKEKFEVLRNVLQKKYGASTTPKRYQYTGNELYKEYDEFYQCLAYSGCGQWAEVFETPTKDIVISLVGISRGTGFLKINAEAVPDFSKALEKYKTLKNSADGNAL